MISRGHQFDFEYVVGKQDNSVQGNHLQLPGTLMAFPGPDREQAFLIRNVNATFL